MNAVEAIIYVNGKEHIRLPDDKNARDTFYRMANSGLVDVSMYVDNAKYGIHMLYAQAFKKVGVTRHG